MAEPSKILAEAANLEVNVSKTYLVPLFDGKHATIQKIVRHMSWSGMGIELEGAQNLGFRVCRRTHATSSISDPLGPSFGTGLHIC